MKQIKNLLLQETMIFQPHITKLIKKSLKKVMNNQIVKNPTILLNFKKKKIKMISVLKNHRITEKVKNIINPEVEVKVMPKTKINNKAIKKNSQEKQVKVESIIN